MKYKNIVIAALLSSSVYGQNKVYPQSSIFKSDEDGVTFAVIGNIGISDHKKSNYIFDTINQFKSNAVSNSNSKDDFDFIVTAGDNIYPSIQDSPTFLEFNQVQNLFEQRAFLRNIPIYPVRGNHDAEFDEKYEMQIQNQFKDWQMESVYYQSEFKVGPDGEKMMILHIDSPYLFCAVEDIKSKSSQEINDILVKQKCQSDKMVQKGNEMIDWFKNMSEEAKDRNVIWKAVVMHHPIFALKQQDTSPVLDDFLQLLKYYEFDLIISGHEHNMSYSYTNLKENKQKEEQKIKDKCFKNTEYFPQEESGEQFIREQISQKGEKIHQVNVGASGYELSDVCKSQALKSSGCYMYVQNKYDGFAIVQASTNQLIVKFKGIDKNNVVTDLYTVQIQRSQNQQDFFLQNDNIFQN